MLAQEATKSRVPSYKAQRTQKRNRVSEPQLRTDTVTGTQKPKLGAPTGHRNQTRELLESAQ